MNKDEEINENCSIVKFSIVSYNHQQRFYILVNDIYYLWSDEEIHENRGISEYWDSEEEAKEFLINFLHRTETTGPIYEGKSKYSDYDSDKRYATVKDLEFLMELFHNSNLSFSESANLHARFFRTFRMGKHFEDIGEPLPFHCLCKGRCLN